MQLRYHGNHAIAMYSYYFPIAALILSFSFTFINIIINNICVFMTVIVITCIIFISCTCTAHVYCIMTSHKPTTTTVSNIVVIETCTESPSVLFLVLCVCALCVPHKKTRKFHFSSVLFSLAAEKQKIIRIKSLLAISEISTRNEVRRARL